jgi:molecular chaperone GrpE
MSKHKNDLKVENKEVTPPSESQVVPAQIAEDSFPNVLNPDTQDERDAVVPDGEGVEKTDANGEQATFMGALTAAQEELESARKELKKLTVELADLNDKYLRKLADEVNFRKRMVREKEETQRFAVAALLTDIIPVLDDFDRGISSADTSKSYDQLREGVVLIRRQLSQMLENKYALKRMESKGASFDPNKHEALFAEQANIEEPVVSEEYLPGYILHDRVLRTAKVRVKMPAPKAVSQPIENVASDAANGEETEAAGVKANEADLSGQK